MNVRIYPDPVLRISSEKVDKINSTVKRIIKSMKETMIEEEGIGLAANQVGITRKIIVVDFFDSRRALINPEITGYSEEKETAAEGCLSFPELAVPIERAKEVKVKYMDEDGIIREETFSDIHARAMQHEIDHINGKLIIDYLPGEDRLEYNLKIARNGVNNA